MRHPALVGSLLTVAFVALAGSGCDQLLSALQQAEQQHDGTGTGTAGASGGLGAGGKQGAAGSSGAASGSCVAEMGPTGLCKRCYDASGLLILEDCVPPSRPPTPDAAAPPPPPPKCDQTSGADGAICKTCWDATTGMVISNDCAPAPTGTGGATGTGACIQIDDGGPSSCKDEATWKTYGTDRCAQQNLT